MGKSGGRKKKGGGGTSTSGDQSSNLSSANVDLDTSVFLKRTHELKEEGNRLFQSRDYASALQQYDAALRLLPRSHPDRAIFHSNRAACFMQMRPVDHDAVAAECSLALEAQPRFPRALLRRARAFEALHRNDLALQDVQALLSLDPSHRDALDLARRLGHQSDTHHHHHRSPRPSPAALGASAALGIPIAGLGPCLPGRSASKKPSSSPPPPPTTKPNKLHSRPASQPVKSAKPLTESPASTAEAVESAKSPALIRWQAASGAVVGRSRPLKLVYDQDIRLAQMQADSSFHVLREIVSKRFPSSKSVLIKYKDTDGDLVTITSTAELRLAESCADQVGMKETKNASDANKTEPLRTLRLQIVEVDPDQEPPLPVEDEEKLVEDDGLIMGDEVLLQSPTATDMVAAGAGNVMNDMALQEEASKGQARMRECDHNTECKEIEIDDWLLEFAQLFRDQVGLDQDAHPDFNELGMEFCSEALEETVTSEEAQGLFMKAAAKFQEVAALAFFNWGNVHMCAARKRMPLDESSPKEIMAAQLCDAYDWVRDRYALAGKKYEDALQIKPDFYEGLLALGQQHFETAKLHWSFALANKVNLTTWDSSETIKLFDSAEEKMKAATEMWEKVEGKRINELKETGTTEKEELLKKKKKQGSCVDGHGEPSADEVTEQAMVMRSQIHLFWGNMLFERSQVEFKLAIGDWEKNLNAAVERFKLAGAAEADISAVLKNHVSNAVTVKCDEKKVVDLTADSAEANVKDENKHVLEN